MAKYAKCPRCELNYIDILKQQYCDVCQKEMKGLIDEEVFFADEEETSELCPICGENVVAPGEKMCSECKRKSEYEEEADVDAELENDEEWREYLDDDTTDADDIGVLPEDEMLDDEEEEEEEESEESEDDFEYVTGDDIYKYAEGDDDDDDDDDDEKSDDDDF